MKTALALLLLAAPAHAQLEIPAMIRGTYAHPQEFWNNGARLDEYGINAVCVHTGGLNSATVARARAEGYQVYAEFATLNGEYGDKLYKHP
ncbi:MAG: hypothetical protein FJY95_16935 [Candidatus Handelsmanbacteria bacterium]|nr:hypothetical protein [Candidatus Handelsmanbacteria bacterium]